jgi:hypothetical protein
MSGLCVLQELFNDSDMRVCQLLRTDLAYQVALGLENATDKDLYIDPRTYHNFRNKLMANRLGDVLFADITAGLIEKFNVDLRLQRMDSVHISTNMKKAGRLALLTATVEKLLHRLQTRLPESFNSVDQDLAAPYLPDPETGRKCFGFKLKPEERANKLRAVAWDMYELAVQFESDPVVSELPEYKTLARVLDDQCEIVGDARKIVKVKSDDAAQANPDRELDEFWDDELEPPGGTEVNPKDPKSVSCESVQWPTDLGAQYDGYKGKGYQVQIVETCTDDGDEDEPWPNLVIYAELEGAAKADSGALIPAIDQLEKDGHLPERLLADTGFGANENFAHAASMGVALRAPVPGKEPAAKVGRNIGGGVDEAQSASFVGEAAAQAECAQDEIEPPENGESAEPLKLSDFSCGEDGEVEGCPMGRQRLGITFTGPNRRVRFDHKACSNCPARVRCPVTVAKKQAWLCYNEAELTTSKRRAFEKTDEFRDQYRMRSGIEGTNSFLARLGLKRLRVRGFLPALLKVKLKVLAVNIRRILTFVSKNKEENAFI